eukprot:TRINITY_DN1203_c0_g1_i2.p1 TRINITY_DN1203_c0_g1~~TRINITY_DN1203_c0_g1_i2.p1  ORF type:complete len:141 (-),score=43.52 TRINITY_DN1203_c0_g1_i2:90-482(-)
MSDTTNNQQVVSLPTEKKKVGHFEKGTLSNYMAGPMPFLLLGAACAAGGLIYGLRAMVKGDMKGQARGMSMRIGFQAVTIAAAAFFLNENEKKKKAEKKAKLERLERKKALREAERLEKLGLQADTAAIL